MRNLLRHPGGAGGGFILLLLSFGAPAASTPAGYVIWDVIFPGNAGEFDIANQTGPNASTPPDTTFPIATSLNFSSLSVTVHFSDGSSVVEPSSYFTLAADNESFNGSPIAIGGTNPLPTSATLTGAFSATFITLTNGTAQTIASSFTATITPSSGTTLQDGDFAVIDVGPAAPSSVPSSGVCNGTYNQPHNGSITVPPGGMCVLVNSSVGGNIIVQGNGGLTCASEAVYGTIELTGSGGALNFTGGSIDSKGDNFSVIATNPQAVNLYNTSTNFTVEINGSGGTNPQGVDIEGTHIYGSLVTNSAYSVLLVNSSIVEQNAEFFGTTNVPSHFTTSLRNTLCNVTIGGTLEVERNTAAFGIGAGNGCPATPAAPQLSVHVDGSVIVTGNNVAAAPPTPSVTIDQNYINGVLSCSGNTPGPSESAPKNNTAGGGATGQCAGFSK